MSLTVEASKGWMTSNAAQSVINASCFNFIESRTFDINISTSAGDACGAHRANS